MWIHWVRTVLLLQYIECHKPQPYSQMETATITAAVKDEKNNLLSCQRCLISQVGALRAKLSRPKNGAGSSNGVSEQFIITVASSDFWKLYPLCETRRLCHKITITSSSIVRHDTNEEEDHVLAGINQPSTLFVKVSESEKRKPEIVCLVRSSSSSKCRSCLTQFSESPYFGEFIMYSAVSPSKLVQIFSAWKTVEDIVNFCSKQTACPRQAAQLSGKVCKPLIVGSPLQDIPLKEDDNMFIQEYLTASHTKRTVYAYPKSTSLMQHCYKSSDVLSKTLHRRIKSVIGVNNGFAVLLQRKTGQTFSQYINFFSPSRTFRMPESDKAYFTHEDSGVCNELNAEYFNILPVPDQYPYWVSQTHYRASQYGSIRHPTRCVWAYHTGHKTACHSCVKSLRIATKGIAAYSISTLSPTSSLHFLKDGIKASPLAMCDRNVACNDLLFVPDFICEYEFNKEEFLQREQQAAEEFPTRSIDRNQVKEIATSENGPVNSERIRVSLDSAMSTNTAKLVGNDIDHNSEVNQISIARSAPARKSATSASRKRTRVSESENPCLERNVMVVEYEFDDQKTCLQSLALEHDVLMISPMGKYVWMICEPEEPLHGNGCKDLTILLRLQRDVDMLRSLSAYSVEDHSLQKKTYRDEPQLINSRQRSNTTPKQTKRAKRARSEESIDVTSDDEDDEDDADDADDEDDENYTGRRGREEAISTFRKGDRKASRSGEDSPSTENSDSVGKDPLHFLHNVPKGKRTSMEYEWKE